jgi:uroporphyrinogen-III synthase
MNQLQSLTIMITRPRPQGERLAVRLQEEGACSFLFPTVEIISLASHLTQSIRHLDTFDRLIFISPQAVQQTAAMIKAEWPFFPENIKVAAIGGSTAESLIEAGLPVHFYPRDDWTSEGLLSLPDFQEVTQQKIALIKGEGGRALLANELKHRGADVFELIAYRRCLPMIDMDSCLHLLNQNKIDIIISTSNEILQNLVYLLGEKAGPYLYSIPLVVVSDRMILLAKQLGFQTILLAKNASHDAIIAILKDHICQMKQKK